MAIPRVPPKKPAAKKPAAKKPAAKKPAAKKPAAKKPAAKKPAAKKPAARVSPLRGMPVDAWIAAKAKGWQGEVIRRVLAVALRVAPGASCSIKWGQPVLELGGPLMFLRPAKAHVSVGFWRGGELSDPKGLLQSSARMGHWKVRGPDLLDEAALADFLSQATRLNREKGSPTSRGG